MADSYSCNINIDPDSVGNMYFRGIWQFCPEYKTGDVVMHNGEVYLCIKPHAGKDPVATGNNEYWIGLSGSSSGSGEEITLNVLDGGYATTLSSETYSEMVNGGSSSGKRKIPLI